jgi:quercetin dioxygenase-like cupin family protein
MKKIIFASCIVSLLFIAASADDAPGVGVETLVKSTSSWDGAALPDYPRGRPEVTVLRIRIPAGAKLDMHRHPVINAGVLLSGELTVVTKDYKKLSLKAGDALIEVVDTWHYGKNEGIRPAEIIVFYAGVEGAPITVK